MDDSFTLPNVPGYVDIKEAAKLLGVAESSVYRYIQSGRLSAYQAGRNIMISEEALKQFQPSTTGRPRATNPLWRISPEESTLWQTSLAVRIREGQEEAFKRRLEEIRRKKEHLFPGTIARYIVGSKRQPGYVEMIFIWRGSVMPDETKRQQALHAFEQALADVVDWETVVYDDGPIFMHA
jgi:excisionase family DNA binding protein